jgi:uncharacterized protein YhaN
VRIRALELLAFGPFRDQRLDFSAPGLHVVLGRNEAGKSTTLRAITGLLYGIDARTTDAHVHKMADLRIGGVLEDGAGREVRVVRRKGNTNTLLGDRGEPVDEGVMKKLLAGVSKESFVHAFGLTHEALAAGAHALLEGRGDLGESLFDASVGGGGEVQRLVAELRAEAERIYKPRGTTLPLNDALKSFAEAQRAIRERESRPEAFVEQERGLTAALAAQDEQLRARAELAARRARLDRARRRAPLEKRQQRARERLVELALSTEHVERITALKERFAGYRHALEQRAMLLAEAERLVALVGDSARRAGLEAKDAGAVRLDARTETRVNGLLRDRTKHVAALEAATLALAKNERELARLVESTSGAPTASPAVIGALAAAIDRARNLGDAEGRSTQRRAQAERRRVELSAKSTAGGLFHGALEAFVGLRVPAVASVERLETRYDERSTALARIDERLASLEKEAASLERQIAGRSGDFAPPDASALEAARRARDAGWRAFIDSPEPERRALAVGVERLLRDADAVADRMIREADRVTALAQLRSEAATNAEQRERLAADRARALAERGALEGELEALFTEAGITPPHGAAFGEMIAWLERHAKIAEAFAELRAEEGELAGDEQRSAAVREELVAARSGVGAESAPSARLPELIAAGAQWLAAVDVSRRAAEDAARQAAKVRADIDERAAARQREEAALAEVSRSLAELIVPLGVPADATAEEVSGSLEALKELSSLAERRADVEARARALDGNARELERELARAVAELAPDLGQHDVRDAAPMLFARAVAAHAEHQELARVSAELDAEDEAVLDETERELIADPGAIGRALEELEERIESLEERIRRSEGEIGRLRAGLEALRAESNAAEASVNAQLHLARVRDHVERWCRVRLAEHVLSREIERYRQENQGPLLAASSELFARLTLGSFSGVKVGHDDKDRPCLRCVRAGGAAEIDMEGLSDGTRDQLYLSLRLASLLRRADALEPMPVILDDVLVQVDDQRAAAALGVLAEVSRRMQVLFFTHHARLVELARASVSPRALTVHELVSGRYAEESRSAPAP